MHYFLPVLGLLMAQQGTLRLPSHEERSRFNAVIIPVGIDVWEVNEPIEEVLKSISKTSPIRIAKTEFPLRGRVTAKMINVPPNFAVERIVSPAGGKVVESDRYPYILVDRSDLPESSYPWPNRLVTLDIADSDVRAALKLIFEGTDLDYTIENDFEGKVTLRTAKQPIRLVINALLEQGNFAYRVEGGVIRFYKAFKPWSSLPMPSTNTGATVSYFLAGGQSRRDALSRFAKLTNTSYVVEPDVDLTDSVSLLIQNETVASALSKILGPNLRFVIHDWRFHISKR